MAVEKVLWNLLGSTKLYFTHLRSVQTDDPIYIPCTVKEVGDCDSMFTCGNPVLLGGGINLKDVGPCTEDRLLSVNKAEGSRDDYKSITLLVQ